METKDPALTKTPINSDEATKVQTDVASHADTDHAVDMHDQRKGTQTLQETVVNSELIDEIESLDDDSVNKDMVNRNADAHIAGESVTHQQPLRDTAVEANLAERDIRAQNAATAHNNNDELAADTSVSNHTDTFTADVADSKHVNDGDNPARQPDRRDQSGSPFDENINEETVGSEAPQSHEINDMNRYATIDNAQTRILNPDEKD